MKNIIHILVDAACSCNIGDNSNRKTVTPYLDELIQGGLYSSNMQTMGPYTEAALVSQLGGEKTMQHGGYLCGLKNVSSTLAETLKAQGYYTISTASPYIYSQANLRGIDQSIDISMFSLESLRSYRLDYYKSLFHMGQLTSFDKTICIDLVEDAFNVWLEQLNGLIENNKNTMLVAKYLEYNPDNDLLLTLNQVVSQQKEFLCDKAAYVNCLLEQGESHQLYQINKISITQKATEKTKLFVKNQYGQKLASWQLKSNKLFKKNNKLSIKYLYNIFNSTTGLRKRVGLVRATVLKHQAIVHSNCLYKNAIENYDSDKSGISVNSILNWFEEQILSIDKKNQAYYTYIHLEDFHLPSKFFTFDTEDTILISKELSDAEKYVHSLPDNYKGNIEQDLAMIYMDRKIGEFINSIKEKVKNDVIFVILADHGNPFYYNPVRPNWNNFCYENFTVPFLVSGNANFCYKTNKRTSTIDIVPTILHLSENEIPSCYSGQIIGEEKYIFKNVGSEYMGPGCPDFTRKPICYSIADNDYKIGVRVLLSENISINNIFEIYDLKADNQNDIYNLWKKQKKNPGVEKLLEEITLRHKELQMLLLVEKR